MAEVQKMRVYGKHPPCGNNSRLEERRIRRYKLIKYNYLPMHIMTMYNFQQIKLTC